MLRAFFAHQSPADYARKALISEAVLLIVAIGAANFVKHEVHVAFASKLVKWSLVAIPMAAMAASGFLIYMKRWSSAILIFFSPVIAWILIALAEGFN